MAYIHSKKKQLEQAATIFGAADYLREMIESTPTRVALADYETEISAPSAKMDKSDFERAWANGQKLPMYEVVALATWEP